MIEVKIFYSLPLILQKRHLTQNKMVLHICSLLSERPFAYLTVFYFFILFFFILFYYLCIPYKCVALGLIVRNATEIPLFFPTRFDFFNLLMIHQYET